MKGIERSRSVRSKHYSADHPGSVGNQLIRPPWRPVYKCKIIHPQWTRDPTYEVGHVVPWALAPI